MGEVIAAVPLLRRLRQEHPSIPIFVSTTTLAGRTIADEKLKDIAAAVIYLPIDYRSCVRRVLRALRPALVVILETEIWPNLFREARLAGAALIIVNGRISDRALPRYRKWRWFFRHVLQFPNVILTQTDEDTRRFIEAGAPGENVRDAGNLKYDFNPSEKSVASELAEFLDRYRSAKVWVAASTMPPVDDQDFDEDDAVIEAFQVVARQEPRILLILAPRKPERFNSAAEKLQFAAIPFVRRTSLKTGATPAQLSLPGVLLLDTIGELASLFSRADAVFMGGTIARRGGHNILEPACFGKPVIAGPHMENFAAIAAEFRRARALRPIDTASDLASAVIELLGGDSGIGMRAQALAGSKRGVTGRIADEVWTAYGEGVPAPMRPIYARAVLAPLSWLWLLGSKADLWLKHAQQITLRTPVVSIGNLTMGGAGKSPLVAHIAERMYERGMNPAILTRGYGRKSAQLMIVTRGQEAPKETTGDEAQIFIRAAHAHVGIAANRAAVAREIEAKFAPGVFLLDDGFQHLRLGRKHDLVLVDALDPFGGGVFPIGRAREGESALRRATAIIITRTEPGVPTSGLERRIRRHNAAAPIFRSRVRSIEWIDLGTRAAHPLMGIGEGPIGAFCGLGNPASFWKTLAALQLKVAFREVFPDHYTYRAADLERLTDLAKRTGATAVVTTEKDALNIPEHALRGDVPVAQLKLYWLKIGVEIENEQELLRLICS